jgi:hypothetical protein
MNITVSLAYQGTALRSYIKAFTKATVVLPKRSDRLSPLLVMTLESRQSSHIRLTGIPFTLLIDGEVSADVRQAIDLAGRVMSRDVRRRMGDSTAHCPGLLPRLQRFKHNVVDSLEI